MCNAKKSVMESLDVSRLFRSALPTLALIVPHLAMAQTPPRVDLSLPSSPPLDTPAPAKSGEPAPVPVDKSQFNFFNPTPAANLRGFSTDRPTKSYTPITVDAGHLQYETDILVYTHSNAGGLSTQQFTSFDPVVKLGLTDHIEFGMQFGGYNWLDARTPGSNREVQQVRGVGDLTLRPKINLFGNEGGVALALIPFVKFPTAARYLGNGHLDGGLIVPFTAPLPYGFQLSFSPELDVFRNGTNSGHHINFTQAFNIGHPIGTKLTVYAEFASSVGPDRGTPNLYTVDVATAYLLTETLQLDVGANFGVINSYSPNAQIYAGVSQRF